jgi:hypothetical protein
VTIVNAWQADAGTTPVGRVEIDNAAPKSYSISFDDVIVDQGFG